MYELYIIRVDGMYENKIGKDITILESPHFYLANQSYKRRSGTIFGEIAIFVHIYIVKRIAR